MKRQLALFTVAPAILKMQARADRTLGSVGSKQQRQCRMKHHPHRRKMGASRWCLHTHAHTAISPRLGGRWLLYTCTCTHTQPCHF
jgi:hypothetical protein